MDDRLHRRVIGPHLLSSELILRLKKRLLQEPFLLILNALEAVQGGLY